MKKLLILFLFAGIAFSTTSCKKKECPKPEVWAPGTWNATKFFYQGQEQDASDPQIACYISDVIEFNEDGTGHWEFHTYDSNSSTCNNTTYPIQSWAENLKNKTLFIDIDVAQLKFEYSDKTHMKWAYSTQSGNYMEFEKQ